MIPVAPATRDGWSFSGGDLSAQASNLSWHRRATVPELEALIKDVSGTKDPTVHWYEAQLLHYGLPPSKTKSTAKLRLIEAVVSGNLVVPKEIAKVEADLKREYLKREREAKQALKAATTNPPSASIAKGKKRTAESAGLVGSTNVNINLSVSVNGDGSYSLGQPALAPAAKKAKSAATSKRSAVQTPVAAAKSTTAKAAAISKPRTPKPASTPSTPARQTARCSSRGGSSLSGRMAAPYHEPPPPYPGFPGDGGFDFDGDVIMTGSRQASKQGYSGTAFHGSSPKTSKGHGSSPQKFPSSSLPPLGLLNGRYKIFFNSGPFSNGESHLIMTLDRNALWGYFDFGGVLKGVLRIDARPYQASWERVCFRWCSEDNDVADDGSFLTFMGEGEINGGIHYYGHRVEFDGERVSGTQTKSEISSAEMRRMWETRCF